MNSKGYPFDNSTKKKEEENKKKSYLVFQINQRGIEKELEKYYWEPNDIPQLHNSSGFRYSVIKLSELMKYAKVKKI